MDLPILITIIVTTILYSVIGIIWALYWRKVDKEEENKEKYGKAGQKQKK